jgi:DNA-binding transcriptional MerR regulator
MEVPGWTLDELAERVDAALAVDYQGQSSGRVRDVPDRRAIRWYTTIGLIDRPVAHRGRTALYGPRHLLQLVAVKRLQATGLPLVAIQQELAGATDTELRRVARVPATAASPPQASAGPPVGKVAAGPAARRLVAGPARRTAFWRQPPVAALAAAGSVPPPGAGVASIRGVRLGEGATLLLEPGRDLDAADLSAIHEAAQPLLAVLRARRLDGLANPVPTPRRADDGEPRREHP